MRGVIHPVSGGVAGLCAASLVAFATDLATKPTDWAIPVAAAVLVIASILWLTTRAKAQVPGLAVTGRLEAGEQNVLTHHGQGDIVQGRRVEVHHHAEPGPAGRTAQDGDRETYEDIVGLVGRNEIRFLREHDFGNAWSREVTMSFFELVETRDGPEHEFHDQQLEGLRRRLQEASERLVSSLAADSHWVPGSDGMLQIVGSERRRDEPPEGEHFERYEARREKLNRLAGDVASAYDNLVREARRRLP